MIYIVSSILLFVAILYFVFKKRVIEFKDKDFEAVKRVLWDLRFTAEHGSTVLIQDKKTGILLQFIKITDPEPSVKFFYPESDETLDEIRKLKEKLKDFQLSEEPGDTKKVRSFLAVDVGDNFNEICNLTQKAMAALGFNSEDRFTLSSINYKLNKEKRISAEQYAKDIISVRPISLPLSSD